jgi:hypothetical protein
VKVGDRVLPLLLGALLATVACGAPPPVSPEPPPVSPEPPPTSPTPTGEPLPPQPPVAVLNFPGGQPTAGDLGTYSYRGAGSDAPWLPGERVAVPPAGALAQVVLSEPLRVTSWWARVAPAGRAPGIGEEREIATGEGPIVFELPTGAWTLQLSVQFGDGIGEATWYWQLGQG